MNTPSESKFYLTSHFITEPSTLELPNTFNPWRHRARDDLPDAVENRKRSLFYHLYRDPVAILIGEAPGCHGCRRSGIPFTDEDQIAHGDVPDIRACRMSKGDVPDQERSARYVWTELRALGIHQRVVMWNSFPLHPHAPGDQMSNRTPSAKELELGKAYLRRLIVIHADVVPVLIAVGQKARGALESLDLDGVKVATVRHPSMGGLREFRSGLAAVVERYGLAELAALPEARKVAVW